MTTLTPAQCHLINTCYQYYGILHMIKILPVSKQFSGLRSKILIFEKGKQTVVEGGLLTVVLGCVFICIVEYQRAVFE